MPTMRNFYINADDQCLTGSDPVHTAHITISKLIEHGLCTAQYEPVCAIKTVQSVCDTEPCPNLSIYQTYSNSCNAMQDNAAIAFNGPCIDEDTASLKQGAHL